MKPWKQLSHQYALKTPWFNIRADRCEIAEGKIIEPFYVMETFDWVHVVALTSDLKMLLVRQYRYAAKRFVEELPGGLMDKGEDPLATAQRELEEETGATAAQWTHLASLHPDPARMDNRVHTFLAEGISITKPQALDEHEELLVHSVAFDEIENLIQRGDYVQSTQIASYYLAKRHLERRALSVKT